MSYWQLMEYLKLESVAGEEELKNNVYKMQLQKVKYFKSQDPKNAPFDVLFEIDGKILYANKYVLITSSETLDSWLSDRWTKNNDPIKIETYSFEVFYEFCYFLYSGGCNLTKENIFKILDAAEFFSIQVLKEFCEKFIMKNFDKFLQSVDILDLYELAEKYSMSDLIERIDSRLYLNFRCLIHEKNFLKIQKAQLLRMCSKFNMSKFEEATILEIFYKWAENQAKIKKDKTGSADFDLEQCIKNEFQDFMPFIKVKENQIDAFIDFISDGKLFLFSVPEFLKIVPYHYGSPTEKIFPIVFQMAEYQVMKRLKIPSSTNKVVQDAIKNELNPILTKTTFFDVSFGFVLEFLVKNSFLFSSKTELYKILAECKRKENQEEQLYLTMYQLAEKEVLKKQKLKCENNINLNDAIKSELAEFLPKIHFNLMDQKFLQDFVVGKGIILQCPAVKTENIKVDIQCGNKVLVGTFEDKLGIAKKVGNKRSEAYSSKEPMEMRFKEYKFEIPTTQSEFKKEDKIEWYLCLNFEGVLTVKNYSLINEMDYLIAEMKFHGKKGGFRFAKNEYTYLFAKSL